MKKLTTSVFFILFLCAQAAIAQPVHKVLIEEFTTASCGNCPMMSQYIRTWHEANAANSIMVSIHEGSGVDAMSSSTTAAIFNAMHPAGGWFAPAVMIERAIYPSTGGEAYLSCYQSWGSSQNGPGVDSIATRLIGEAPVVGIDISGNYNSASRMLDASVTITFVEPVNAGDWRINLFLVEDSVVGWPGLGAFAGWDQHCYDANWANSYYPGMFDGTSIIGYPHRHVMRNSFFGNWGAAGVIPSIPVIGVPYTTSGSIALDTAFHDDHLTLVAFVSSYGATKADKFVLNANDVRVTNNFTTTVPDLSSSNTEATLFPVPASGLIHLTWPAPDNPISSIKISDLSGRELKMVAPAETNATRNEISFDASGLSKGIYVLTALGKKKNFVRRLIVN